jgi:uncharacterized protein YprB with RNaseH-like and TPR domain
MGNLQPVAFDIETTGFEPGSVITVAGLATQQDVVLVLNTADRTADQQHLETVLNEHTSATVGLTVCHSEHELLTTLADCAEVLINTDTQYLTAYNGETWSGGFDLPFLRTACVRCSTEWPFPDMAYADVMDVVKRFDTQDNNDLVSAYNFLIGTDSCDPFDDSEEAVDAFRDGDWLPLLLHNLADVVRTRELAALGGRYVAKSDFGMKNLAPPS